MERLCINSQSVTHSVTQQGRHRAARAAKNCEDLLHLALIIVCGNVRSQLCAATCAHKCVQPCALTNEMNQ